MIFVTVGCQLPFTRLITYVEQYYKSRNESVIAQIGNDNKKYEKMKSFNYMSAEEYNLAVSKCKLIIGHCGTGTIYSAMKYKKKLIAVPREKKFDEHRSDHQIDTAEIFKNNKSIIIARNYKDFENSIDFDVSLFEDLNDGGIARVIAKDIENVLSS
jgi:UDP-N-acetylglucosamine transferase subunit ALG13